ncbi:hypothetical protein QUF70_01200 [Desulfobacterales bacterium HSG17]|nr:hypothetical protein [Desulfobacterales bacterium HSG17]
MSENANQNNLLNNLDEKTQKRIEAGRDKLTANLHGAMEAILINLQDLLIPGEIVTSETLEQDLKKQFHKLQISLDLSPFAHAVFLPSGIYRNLNSYSHLQKTASAIIPDDDNDTSKVLVSGISDYKRILTAEISPAKPGIDIFDDGSLLASYNYNTPHECINDLSKIIWIHFKYKDAWNHEDYIRYTEGWFFRSANYKIPDLSINVNHSYIHHPVLINTSSIQAIFKLMKATLLRLFAETDKTLAAANAANLYKPDTVKISKSGLSNGKEDEKRSLNLYYEDRLVGLLKLLQGYEIINFKSFSAAEQKEFKRMFARTVEDVFQSTIQKIFNNISMV